MTQTSQAPVRYIDAVTQRYARLGYDTYRWFAADSAPALTPLARPLSQSRLGVLTTSGCYRAGQIAFHYRDDSSLRRIASDTPPDQLRFSHLTENYLVDARKDPECLVPLGALHQQVFREQQVDGVLLIPM
jgi:D-proline reductase (dithiol) PrdB